MNMVVLAIEKQKPFAGFDPDFFYVGEHDPEFKDLRDRHPHVTPVEMTDAEKLFFRSTRESRYDFESWVGFWERQNVVNAIA